MSSEFFIINSLAVPTFPTRNQVSIIGAVIFTTVFGMGTGVTPQLSPPGKFLKISNAIYEMFIIYKIFCLIFIFLHTVLKMCMTKLYMTKALDLLVMCLHIYSCKKYKHKKRPRSFFEVFFIINSLAVPTFPTRNQVSIIGAVIFTAVFGMGTGVTPQLSPPRKFLKISNAICEMFVIYKIFCLVFRFLHLA